MRPRMMTFISVCRQLHVKLNNIKIDKYKWSKSSIVNYI